MLPVIGYIIPYKQYLDVLLYDRIIIGPSSEIFGYLWKSLSIFGYLRKMFGNVCLAFGQLLQFYLLKYSESVRKSSENHQKCHH